MLCIEIRPGAHVTIGDNIILKLPKSAKHSSVVCIEAPREVAIVRSDAIVKHAKPLSADELAVFREQCARRTGGGA